MGNTTPAKVEQEVLGRTIAVVYRRRNQIIRQKGYPDYMAYLHSDEYRQARDFVLRRHGYECIVCGAPSRAIHHVEYSHETLSVRPTLGRDGIPMVMALCQPCHRRAHWYEDGSVVEDLTARALQLLHDDIDYDDWLYHIRHYATH